MVFLENYLWLCDIKCMHFSFVTCIHLLNIIVYSHPSSTTCAQQVFHVHISQTENLIGSMAWSSLSWGFVSIIYCVSFITNPSLLDATNGASVRPSPGTKITNCPQQAKMVPKLTSQKHRQGHGTLWSHPCGLQIGGTFPWRRKEMQMRTGDVFLVLFDCPALRLLSYFFDGSNSRGSSAVGCCKATADGPLWAFPASCIRFDWRVAQQNWRVVLDPFPPPAIHKTPRMSSHGQNV